MQVKTAQETSQPAAQPTATSTPKTDPAPSTYPANDTAPVRSSEPNDDPNPPETQPDPTQPAPTPTPTPAPATATCMKPSDMDSNKYPVLMDLMHPKEGNVMQNIHYNRDRREYYVSMAFPGTNGDRQPYETTIITRLDDSGKYIDEMKLLNAGHGTGMVVENYGKKNTVYIWLPWANTSTKYYRFPYKSGSFRISTLPTKTLIPKFTTRYVTYHLDWETDTLMERVTHNDNTSTLNKRKISELLNKVDHVYATITTEVVTTDQGWATINDKAFVYQGAPNGETLNPAQPTLLDTYSWTTGARVDRVNLNNLAKDSATGKWRDGHHEPEGLGVYRSPTTGKASLIVGINSGKSGNHKYWIYRYSNIGSAPVSS